MAADIIIFIGLGLGGRRKGRLPAPKAAGALCTSALRGPHRADPQNMQGLRGFYLGYILMKDV